MEEQNLTSRKEYSTKGGDNEVILRSNVGLILEQMKDTPQYNSLIKLRNMFVKETTTNINAENLISTLLNVENIHMLNMDMLYSVITFNNKYKKLEDDMELEMEPYITKLMKQFEVKSDDDQARKKITADFIRYYKFYQTKL